MTLDIAWSSAHEIAKAVRSGEYTVAEVAEATIARIEKDNPGLNAFCVFKPEEIRQRAAELDRRIAAGEEMGPLVGVPFAIKDMTAIKGEVSTLSLIHI